MATVICIKAPPIPPGIKATFPGVGEISFLRDSLTSLQRPSDYLLRALNSLNPALSPIYTLLRLLDMVISIFNCVKAVKDCITSLSPGPLIKCFEKLFKAFAALIQLFPPVVYVRMVLDIISIFRTLIDDIIEVITVIDMELASVNGVIAKAIAEDDPLLLEIGNCAKEDLFVQTKGVYAIIEVFGKCLQLILITLELLTPFVPGLDKKLVKMQEALDAIGSVTASEALKPIVDMLLMIRNVLVIVETPLKIFLGVSIGTVSLTTPALRNP